jgi:gluconokinase
MRPPVVVVMGVSGCGKSTVGQLLAHALDAPYIEGDDLHSQENVERMRAGIALNDAQRRDWLLALAAHLAQAHEQGRSLVVSCSALKRAYRDVLRSGAPDLQLVHLQGSREVLAARSAQRQGHYMPVSLLDSQLATLEPPGADENVLDFNVTQAPPEIVQLTVAALTSRVSPGPHGPSPL